MDTIKETYIPKEKNIKKLEMFLKKIEEKTIKINKI